MDEEKNQTGEQVTPETTPVEKGTTVSAKPKSVIKTFTDASKDSKKVITDAKKQAMEQEQKKSAERYVERKTEALTLLFTKRASVVEKLQENEKILQLIEEYALARPGLDTKIGKEKLEQAINDVEVTVDREDEVKEIVEEKKKSVEKLAKNEKPLKAIEEFAKKHEGLSGKISEIKMDYEIQKAQKAAEREARREKRRTDRKNDKEAIEVNGRVSQRIAKSLLGGDKGRVTQTEKATLRKIQNGKETITGLGGKVTLSQDKAEALTKAQADAKRKSLDKRMKKADRGIKLNTTIAKAARFFGQKGKVKELATLNKGYAARFREKDPAMLRITLSMIKAKFITKQAIENAVNFSKDTATTVKGKAEKVATAVLDAPGKAAEKISQTKKTVKDRMDEVEISQVDQGKERNAIKRETLKRRDEWLSDHHVKKDSTLDKIVRHSYAKQKDKMINGMKVSTFTAKAKALFFGDKGVDSVRKMRDLEAKKSVQERFKEPAFVRMANGLYKAGELSKNALMAMGKIGKVVGKGVSKAGHVAVNAVGLGVTAVGMAGEAVGNEALTLSRGASERLGKIQGKAAGHLAKVDIGSLDIAELSKLAAEKAAEKLQEITGEKTPALETVSLAAAAVMIGKTPIAQKAKEVVQTQTQTQTKNPNDKQQSNDDLSK